MRTCIVTDVHYNPGTLSAPSFLDLELRDGNLFVKVVLRGKEARELSGVKAGQTLDIEDDLAGWRVSRPDVEEENI